MNLHKLLLAAVATACAVVLVACGSTKDVILPPSGSSCPNVVPQSCPGPIPSYANTVAPIISQACLSCHGPGGIEEGQHPLQDYNDVFAQRSAVLDQVAACLMPQDNGVAFSPNDKITLLTWLVCNAPNN